MTAEQRHLIVEQTEKSVGAQPKGDKRHTVLLAQIHCAGTGLNLQFMDRVIFTTPWWTAALMDQAAGRVVRIGQSKKVVIHHLHFKEEAEQSLNIDE